MPLDLHTHSVVSDGTDSPDDLVRKAAAAGLDGLALTDHDTFAGLAEAAATADAVGLRFVPGMEMSTQRDGRSVHLLGYGCDPADEALGGELERVLAGRTSRIRAMVARLNRLGVPLTVEEVARQAGGAPPGRPHVADALVARGHVADRDGAFTRYLAEGGPAWVDRYAPAVEDAIALVHGAGGVAVVAHPWGRGGRRVLPRAVIAELATEHGLDGIEVDHPDHDPDAQAALRALADRLGLLATGSSDHHGLGKTRNPLGAHTTPDEVVGELLERVRSRGGRTGRV